MGQARMYAAHAGRQIVAVARRLGDAAGEPQKSLLGQYRLVDGEKLEGAFEAQVTLIGQPYQRAQAALVALAGQAELVRLFMSDEVLDV